jgi:hypothetical protein
VELSKMSSNIGLSQGSLTWLYRHRKPTWRTQPRQLLVLRWTQPGSQNPLLRR